MQYLSTTSWITRLSSIESQPKKVVVVVVVVVAFVVVFVVVFVTVFVFVDLVIVVLVLVSGNIVVSVDFVVS